MGLLRACWKWGQLKLFLKIQNVSFLCLCFIELYRWADLAKHDSLCINKKKIHLSLGRSWAFSPHWDIKIEILGVRINWNLKRAPKLKLEIKQTMFYFYHCNFHHLSSLSFFSEFWKAAKLVSSQEGESLCRKSAHTPKLISWRETIVLFFRDYVLDYSARSV